jgi:hypothetical protein
MLGATFDRLPGALQFLLEPLGVSLAYWPINKEGVLDFNDGELTSIGLVPPFIQEIQKREALSLWNNVNPDVYGKPVPVEICNELAQRSQAELKNLH